jgi:hypothetical protein
MKKQIRTKILIERIEGRIAKNQRRIKDIAKDNYDLRKVLTGLQALPEGTTLTKKDLEARDKENRAGKYYDAAYHEQKRQEERERKEAAEAVAEAEKPVEGAI